MDKWHVDYYNTEKTLFAYILKNNSDLDKYGSFSALSEDIRDSVDDDL